MDKYEYRVCVEEINALIAERRFEEAKKIADTIDWRRVKNVNMLCKISDLYKINRSFEESRDILEMAHDRYPNGRSIVYGLCELELRLNDFGKAVTYYNDFVAMAPRDSGRYILQYKILSAQSASLEERIGVLEELKKHDYREKWAYTLAALYNQAGMTSKCAQECDEMIAAFGDGRYVIKALQLKKEKTPLTADQTTRLEELTKPIPAQQIEEAAQHAYSQDGQYAGEPAYDQSAQQGGYGQAAYEQGVQQNGYVQDGQYAGEPVYDQAAQQNGYAQEDQYAQQPFYGQESYGQEAYGQQAPYEENGRYAEASAYGQEQAYQEQPYPEQGQDAYGEAAPYGENAGYGAPAEQSQETYGREASYGTDNEQEPQEEIQVKPLDDSQFNTINLQQTVAAGVKELLKQEPPREDDAAKRAARSAAILKELQENEEKQEKGNEEQEEQAQEQKQPAQPEHPETEAAREPQLRMQMPAENTEKTEEQPVTEELIGARAYAAEEEAQEAALRGERYAQPAPAPETAPAETPIQIQTPVQTPENTAEETEQEAERESAPAAEKLPEEQDDFAVFGREAVKPAEAGKSTSWGELPGEALWQQTPEQVVSSAYDAVLAQETDGQYSMALEEEDAPEKQITGQLDIEGIMAEWEKIRRDNEEKRAKENRQRVLQNTGPIIAKFDETSKKGVLENMEREIEAEARSRRQMEARPSGSALSDGLTGEERNSAAVAAGRNVGRAVLEDEPVDEATKKWSPSAVLRTLRKEQALQNLPENYFPEKEEEKGQQESSVAPVAEEKPVQEETLRKDVSPAQPQEDIRVREEASFEQAHDDAYEDDRQDEAYLQEEEEQAQDYYAEDAENAEDAQEAPQEYEDFRDNYDEEPEEEEEPEEDGEDYYGEQEEDAIPEEEEEEPAQEDEDEESEDDMPVRRARNTPVEALHETQDLTEFARGKYGDPEQMSENQREERRRSVDENRSHRQQSASEEERVRAMTREERALFGPYLSEKESRRQILQAIENVSLAACTGNVIVTGDDAPGALNLSKGLIREIQLTDQNFSGKVARSTGEILNRKDFAPVIDRLKNGALIIERAGELNDASVKVLRAALQSEERGLIVILVDTKKAMDNFLAQHQALGEYFTARVDIQPLDNHTLVRYARAYARSRDYSIDEFGILALHTRISSKQTIDHNVTMREVRDMVDDAIYYASRKSLSHLMDILLRKRYDEDDRIILREKDFQHY